ncbi:MAG: PIG-L deacetylase family protein [Flavisolibacter sp.]
MLQTQNILILAPHTDDGELGCGASIAKYISEGKQVHYIAFSSCSSSLPPGLPADTLVKECRAATQALGIPHLRFFDFEVRQLPFHRQEILEELIRIQRDLRPQTVFIPARNDIHQDHQVIYAEGRRAFNNANVLGYELPWNNLAFQPVYFEKIEEMHLAAKQKALEYYVSQTHRPYMQPELTRSLAVVRGIQAGYPLAEAFEVYKLLG